MYLLCITGEFTLAYGDALVLVCAVTFSGHILCCDRFVRLGRPLEIAAIQFVTAAVVSWIAAFVAEEPTLAKLTSAAVPILYCGVMSGAIGYTLQIVAQKYTDPTIASLLMSMESVFAVLAGVIILNEQMTSRELAGCVVMFVAIVLVPAIVICDAGGFASTVNSLNEINPYLQSLFTNASTTKAVGFLGLVSCMAWGLGYFGMPHILVRFMSINNPAEVKGSRRIAMTWVTISLGAAVVIGLVFHLFLKQKGLTLADVGDDPEKCFMVMINHIFSTGLAARVFAGVLLSAILAAIMSTADSQLLVSASSFANDIYKRAKKNASNRELVTVSRLAVAAVAVVAAVMSTNQESDFFKAVMKMVSFAWGGFGAAFGPLILLALFWRRTNLAGAISGMVVGASTCFVWKFVLAAKFAEAHPVFGLYELAPGFALAFAATVVVSLLTKKPSKEITDEFDAVKAQFAD